MAIVRRPLSGQRGDPVWLDMDYDDTRDEIAAIYYFNGEIDPAHGAVFRVYRESGDPSIPNELILQQPLKPNSQSEVQIPRGRRVKLTGHVLEFSYPETTDEVIYPQQLRG